MAVKNNLGKPKNMPMGAVKYAMQRAEANGNTNSKYYEALKDRLAELRSHR